MKPTIMRWFLFALTMWLAEVSANALPDTNEEPAHILIEAAVLTETQNLQASRAGVSSNLFLPGVVSWFTNLVPVIGRQNGMQYFAKFKDPLDLTVAALADEYSVVVIERPRILTRDGQTAQFWVGDTTPYIISGQCLASTGFELDVIPAIVANGLIELNFRWDDANASAITSGPISVSMTNNASITVRAGEIFMAACAMEPPPPRISTFRKSIHSIRALFGRRTGKPDKEQLIVLFRAKEIPD